MPYFPAPGLSNPMTTRGDLIRGGVSGIPERVVAVTADTFIGGDGTDVVARTATQARTSIDSSRVTTETFADNSRSWTLSAGSQGGRAAAAITGGRVLLSLTDSSTSWWDGGGGGFQGPTASINVVTGFSVDPWAWRARVRLVALASGNDNTIGSFAVGQASGTNRRYAVQITRTGNVKAINVSAGTSSYDGGTLAGAPPDGNDWAEIQVLGKTLTLLFGRGTGGAAPARSDMKILQEVTLSDGDAPWAMLHLVGIQADALATSTDVEWDDVSVQSLGLGW